MKARLGSKLIMNIVSVALLFGAQRLRAQGDDNPTGVAGRFNGNVTTGGSYDALTGNASRSVTDLVSPASVGAYPLAFTRTMNTRVYTYASGDNAGDLIGGSSFGPAGGWRHNYEYASVTNPQKINHQCIQLGNTLAIPSQFLISIVYPDGRLITFNKNGVPTQAGIGDRLDFPNVVDVDSTDVCQLHLADGGIVELNILVTHDGTCSSGANGPNVNYFITLALGAPEKSGRLIDPYGQSTWVQFSTDGLTEFVTEPAGRTLAIVSRKITDATEGKVGDTVIDHVVDSSGRTITYGYKSYPPGSTGNIPSLDAVYYFGNASTADPALTAHYTYQDSNAGVSNAPLISTCDDSMYAGPMTAIAYKFSDPSMGYAHGVIASENYYNPTNGAIGVAVSTLSGQGDPTTRTETRGDQHTRTFTYDSSGYLTSWTDFDHQS